VAVFQLDAMRALVSQEAPPLVSQEAPPLVSQEAPPLVSRLVAPRAVPQARAALPGGQARAARQQEVGQPQAQAVRVERPRFRELLQLVLPEVQLQEAVPAVER
jgi:hypothetical protein